MARRRSLMQEIKLTGLIILSKSHNHFAPLVVASEAHPSLLPTEGIEICRSVATQYCLESTSDAPTRLPSLKPTTKPSTLPSALPTPFPSASPTDIPTTIAPTPLPTIPVPTSDPSPSPTPAPVESAAPTFSFRPSTLPSISPTFLPSLPGPSSAPTSAPSLLPTLAPTESCADGEYFDSALSTCQKCPAGKSSNMSFTMRGACDLCSPARYASSTGQAQCSACPVGRSSDAYGSSFCKICGAGKISDLEGSLRCFLCPAGKILTDPGSSYSHHDSLDDCESCNSGKFSSVARVSCQSCPAGTFVFNQSSCELCTPGRYAPRAVLDECIECEAGSSTQTMLSATACVPCPAGTRSTKLSSNCSLCSAGSYSFSRSEHCTKCPKGTYSSKIGSIACKNCRSGTISTSMKSVNCTRCPRGSYQASPGQSSCVECEKGRYQTSVGKSACDFCPAGTMGPASAAKNCTPCAPGRYQPSLLSESCFPCPHGTFQGAAAAVLCNGCTPGSYSSIIGATICVECEAGKYQPAMGSVGCLLCPGGKYSNQSSSTYCKTCYLGRSSLAASHGCFMSERGYFYHPVKGEYIKCNQGEYEGVLCDVPGTTLQSVDISAGYWRATSDSDRVMPCKNFGKENLCRGGNGSGLILCTESHSGPWCQACTPRHFKDSTGSCTSCETHWIDNRALYTSVMVIGFGTLLTIAISAIVSMLNKRNFREEDVRSDNLTQKLTLNSATEVENTLHDFAVFKHIVIYLQQLSSMSEVFGLQVPSPLHAVLYYVRWVLLDIPLHKLHLLGCSAGEMYGSFYTTLVVTTLGPIIFSIWQVVAAVKKSYAHRREGRFLIERQNMLGRVVLCLFIFQPTCTRLAFQTFPCTDYLDDGKRWLKIDLGLDCGTRSHAMLTVYASFMAAFWLLGVGILFVLIVHHSLPRINTAERYKHGRVLDNTPAENALILLSQELKRHLRGGRTQSKIMELCIRARRPEPGINAERNSTKSQFACIMKVLQIPIEYYSEPVLEQAYLLFKERATLGRSTEISPDHIASALPLDPEIDLLLSPLWVLIVGVRPGCLHWEPAMSLMRSALFGVATLKSGNLNMQVAAFGVLTAVAIAEANYRPHIVHRQNDTFLAFAFMIPAVLATCVLYTSVGHELWTSFVLGLATFALPCCGILQCGILKGSMQIRKISPVMPLLLQRASDAEEKSAQV